MRLGTQVLGAAYPWIARRLLTDTSEELKVSLLNCLDALPFQGMLYSMSLVKKNQLQHRARMT